MRKTVAFMVGTLLALILILAKLITLNANTITLYLYPEDTAYSEIRVEFSDQGILQCVYTDFEAGVLRVKLQSLQQGETELKVICDHPDSKEYFSQTYFAHVKRNGMIFIGDRFSNWEWLIYGIAVYFLLLFLFFLHRFRILFRLQRFDYRAMFAHTLMLVHLAGTLSFFFVSFLLLTSPDRYSPNAIFSLLRILSTLLLAVSLPFSSIFAASVSLSNIALMRHEGFRPVNMLGLISGTALVLATLASLILTYTHLQWSILDPVGLAVTITVTVGILFGEALLWSVIACALMCLRSRHSFDQDYILILGCSIRSDGTLYPLLRGRVDTAIEFYRTQLARTGKPAILIPSGGKGADEPMAEAEAMRSYLRSQGIPEAHILVEDRSTTTYENMLFSRQLIESRKKRAKVLFSTTNYHVFRSGMIAAQVGLPAGGIGAKTKWYFWPNAFLREFVGILVRYWKLEVLLLIVIILQTALLGSLGDLIAGFY